MRSLSCSAILRSSSRSPSAASRASRNADSKRLDVFRTKVRAGSGGGSPSQRRTRDPDRHSRRCARAMSPFTQDRVLGFHWKPLAFMKAACRSSSSGGGGSCCMRRGPIRCSEPTRRALVPARAAQRSDFMASPRRCDLVTAGVTAKRLLPCRNVRLQASSNTYQSPQDPFAHMAAHSIDRTFARPLPVRCCSLPGLPRRRVGSTNESTRTFRTHSSTSRVRACALAAARVRSRRPRQSWLAR